MPDLVVLIWITLGSMIIGLALAFRVGAGPKALKAAYPTGPNGWYPRE